MPLLGYIKNNKKVTNAYYLDIIGTPITYEDFMQLTPAQQENGNWYVTGMSPMVNAYSIMYKNGLSIGQALDAGTNDMTGATSQSNGTHGLVPAPQAGDEDKVLKGDGTWGSAGDTATVRYDENTQYVQLKDSQGWFNWRKAARALWDWILDNTPFIQWKPYQSYYSPTVTRTNSQVEIRISSSTRGSYDISTAIFQSNTSSTTVHIKGNVHNGQQSGSRYQSVGYCDWDGSNYSNKVTTSLPASGSFDLDIVIPANKYFFIEVSWDETAERYITLDECYCVE